MNIEQNAANRSLFFTNTCLTEEFSTEKTFKIQAHIMSNFRKAQDEIVHTDEPKRSVSKGNSCDLSKDSLLKIIGLTLNDNLSIDAIIVAFEQLIP